MTPRRGVWFADVAVALCACASPPLRAQRIARRPPALAQVGPQVWLQHRSSVDNTGYVAGTLATRWSYKARLPVRGLAIAGGTIFLGSESADADAAPGAFAPDQRGALTALDLRTGSVRWSDPIPSWVHG